jgi:hypothetical protein
MKVIVAGNRDFYNQDFVFQAIEESGFEIDEVVSGKAKGVDVAGEWYAYNNKIKRTAFPANWYPDGHTLDRSAGPKRNKVMANYADALILVWDGMSRGSADMLVQMIALKKPVFIKCFRRNNNG